MLVANRSKIIVLGFSGFISREGELDVELLQILQPLLQLSSQGRLIFMHDQAIFNVAVVLVDFLYAFGYWLHFVAHTLYLAAFRLYCLITISSTHGA